MMDNIVFEEMWDPTYYHVVITAQSKLISATFDGWGSISQSDIHELSRILLSIPLPIKNDHAIAWIPVSGNGQFSGISFTITQLNKRVGINVEVYMRIKDGDEHDSHFCRFFVQTEIGELEAFGRRLKSLGKDGNMKVALVEST
jgi:hypothetical protein